MSTLAKEISVYRPAVALENVLSRHTMNILRMLFFVGTVVFVSLALAGPYILPTISLNVWWGASLICAALWVDQMLTFGYHNSWYFRGLRSVIDREQESTLVTYDVAKVILKNPNDVTRAFCESAIGKNVLLRTRITPAAIASFLERPRRLLSADGIIIPENEHFTLLSLGNYLLAHDSEFKKLFTDQGIRPEHFLRALNWIVGVQQRSKENERWWSKDNLSKTSGLGTDWSYGTAYTLQKYSRNIATTAVFSTLSTNTAQAEETIAEIEMTLAKSKGANVLLVGEAGVGKMDIVMAVQKRMQTGKSLHAIAGQHIYVLDTKRLFANHRDKQSLEQTLLHLFEEALLAGNTIIVIENISIFIQEAQQYGIYLPELLDEYIATPYLHLIATDTPHGFHQTLEPLGAFIRFFNEILLDTASSQATTQVLEGVALGQESTRDVLFTYESLEAITNAAERYIVEGVMPDKAVTLLIDVASAAESREQILITADFVYQLVSEQTNVPAGPIKEEERDLLLNLEQTLHQYVVGQRTAISAIARTMRRARAGVQASDKPIGSFLFLGPTGVGKTESAKALATVFFGSPEKLERFDMSEFSGADALYRLLGDNENSGALADTLREHPYTVLLLDEFEKASTEVHDLFLQILDEGVFTDGRGTKINARNTIIIATSNAGADLILRTVQQRQELSHLSQAIIDHIIERGLFKPELLNRFDNTIIFEPLTKTEQGSVANLLLRDLYVRIKEQGYELSISTDLLEFLVEKGYNPEFGARPMQRVIQDLIEEKVAKKIIAGSVQRGDTIHLSRDDFTEEELKP